MESIASQSLCSGCGVCTSVCPKGCIEIHETWDGFLRLKINPAQCLKCGLCMKICPHGSPVQKKVLDFTDIRACYAGRFPMATDKSASGGGISWFLCTLLRLSMVDAVIHVIPSRENGVWFKYGISKTPEEIYAGAGSVYCPVSLNEVLEKIKQEPTKRYAVVGLPCFISALDKLRNFNLQYKHQLCVLIGLVCGHLPSRTMTECIAWQAGHKSEEIQSVRYHIHDGQRPAWNYGLELTYKDGTQSKSFGDEDFGFIFWHGLFSQKPCLSCQDIFAEKADIVFMDAWLPEYKELAHGTSLFAVRNKNLLELFAPLLQKGNLKAVPITALNEAQQGLLTKRFSIPNVQQKDSLALIKRISRLCKRHQEASDIISKIRALEYTNRIRHSNHFLYLLLRIKQFMVWHV